MLSLVLRTVKYGDTRLIADLFTAGGGCVSVMVPAGGARGGAARQLFRPMQLIDAEWSGPRKGRLPSVREARLAYVYRTALTDPVKQAQLMFLSEFLTYALRGESEGGAAFDYVADSLQWLDMAEEGVANFHLVFVARLTRFLGIYPNTEGYTPGDWFDLRAAAFTPLQPYHPERLAPQEASLLATMLRMDFANCRLFELNREQRRRFIAVAECYYRLHVPGFPALKSPEILAEMF